MVTQLSHLHKILYRLAPGARDPRGHADQEPRGHAPRARRLPARGHEGRQGRLLRLDGRRGRGVRAQLRGLIGLGPGV